MKKAPHEYGASKEYINALDKLYSTPPRHICKNLSVTDAGARPLTPGCLEAESGLVPRFNKNENADPAAAPMQISNEQFLCEVFGDQAGNAHVTAFPDPPDKLNGNGGSLWAGSRWAECFPNVVVNQNSFFAISIFHPDEHGKAVRRKAQHYATYVIVIDDVGTGASAKVNPSRVFELGLPEPSYKLETSLGNEQWGYLLAGLCTNRTLVENLLNQLVALKLCPDGSDPGMKGVTRYVRLPQGLNNKTKYPEPWRHRMNAWYPGRRYRIEDLAAAVQVDPAIEDQRTEVTNTGEDKVKELLGLPFTRI